MPLENPPSWPAIFWAKLEARLCFLGDGMANGLQVAVLHGTQQLQLIGRALILGELTAPVGYSMVFQMQP